ncbi:MAG: penicillin-binding protein 2 [Actinobacteria bacterium]|nr:penicillin-binding protein 2 [Actinomycetota bacterium]
MRDHRPPLERRARHTNKPTDARRADRRPGLTPDPRHRAGRPAPHRGRAPARSHGEPKVVPAAPDRRRRRAAPPPPPRVARPADRRHGSGKQPVRALQKRVTRAPRVVRHYFRAGQTRRRLLAVFVLTAMVFTVVITRVVMLQTADAESLRAAGRDQRTSETILPATRGVIFDRNGDELALSVPSTTIIANPKNVGDPATTVATLASVLGLTPEKQQSLLTAFTTRDKSFVYVARQVTDDQAAAIDALDIDGIDGIADVRRTMPGGEVGKSVIGRTDDFGIGTAGIEKQYDDLLTGTDGELVREHDRDGRSLPGSEQVSVTPVPGDDVVLTLDRSVQYDLEQAMIDRVSTLGARGGTAIIMDTDTGEILAMVGVRRNDEGVVEVTSGNIAVVDAAEPGSVVKAITVSAALNEGTITPDTMFEVPYAKKFSDTVLHDAEPHATEYWPVSQIVTKSSNVGTIEVMLTLGDTMRHKKEMLDSYLRAFGLGETSPLDFPGESRGIYNDWKKWEGAEQYTMAYGQGVASTSIQLVSAINVIANGGVYVAPKLVKATIGPDGTMTPTEPSGTHRVIRPEVAGQVTTMRRSVVCNGTAKPAQLDGWTIAGKTGTGLKALDNGTYTDEDGNHKYYSSFVGFFPAEAPQVTVLVSIDEPPGDDDQQTRFGGTAAAPVFKEIAPTIIRETNMTPPTPNGGCPEG